MNARDEALQAHGDRTPKTPSARTDKDKAQVLYVFLSVAALVLLAATVALGFAVSSLLGNQADGKVRSLEGRGVTCQLIAGLGLNLPDACLDASVKPYFDRDDAGTTTGSRNSRTTTRLVCRLLEKMGETDSACTE